jgi:hypothetical protein
MFSGFFSSACAGVLVVYAGFLGTACVGILATRIMCLCSYYDWSFWLLEMVVMREKIKEFDVCLLLEMMREKEEFDDLKYINYKKNKLQ